MQNSALPPRLHNQLAHAAPDAQRVLDIMLASLSPSTLTAYSHDLDEFADWFISGSIGQAAETLFLVSQGNANALGFEWRAAMLELGLSPATINRRLSALKSLIKTGRILGLINYELEVPPVKSQSYRDTRGPTLTEVAAFLNAAKDQPSPRVERDVALIRLMYDMALRRGEITKLDVADVEANRLWIMGKGKTEKAPVTMPELAVEAITAWRAYVPEGPLFRHIDRHSNLRQRLTGAGLYEIVQHLGRKAGIKVRPHGFRHSAITLALDLTGGDVRSVMRYARHARVDMTIGYDDRRTDRAGDIAQMVSRTLGS